MKENEVVKITINEDNELVLIDNSLTEISDIELLDDINGGFNGGCNTASCTNNGVCGPGNLT